MITGETWELVSRTDGATVGEIRVAGSDFPWLTGSFAERPGFVPHRALFEDAASRFEAEEWDAYDIACDRIEAALALHTPDGRAVTAFLLHLTGAEATFRRRDEPSPPS
ncbi:MULTISPECIES: hypothetical protein [unclassified Streptomyces]|uniref:hypothetical protein n=1 Tax=unclassified Streptomyces TaxID=2593676 RepID=UPI000CD4FC72|nr:MULTISPECIES: hypothetical protein [unclassified Streptomyces]